MGNIAVTPDEDDAEDLTPDEDMDASQAEKDEDNSSDEGEEAKDEEAGGSEAKDGQQGVSGSQPYTQSEIDEIVRGRLVRQKKKQAANAEDSAALKQELEAVKGQKQLLELARDQDNERKEKPSIPKPGDYDDGVADPKYIEALNSYTASQTETLVREGIHKATADISAAQNRAEAEQSFERLQTQHIEKSIALNVSDFEAMEDKLIDQIGQKAVDTILKVAENSAAVVYFLSKQKGKAESFGSLLDNPTQDNLMKAVARIGAFEEMAKGLPRTKANRAPDPDEELEGGTPSASSGKRGPKGAIYE